MPAPRNRIAWLAETKCVVGASSMSCCTSSGMLSRGVVPPESICSGSSTRISSSANCGIERATVAMNTPIEVVAKRCTAASAMNSPTEPSIGTASAHRTTTASETAAAHSTTSPIDHTLASMISAGVTGMTSRCSTVPCSRSRISAAPVSTIDSMVMRSTISLSEPNHDCSRFWLKRTLSARSTAGTAVSRWRRTNSSTSASTICWM